MEYKTLAISICQHLEHEIQKHIFTRFSRRAYMAQVVPSLMMTIALRHAFDITGREGRIQNVDERMCYTVCLIAQSGLRQFELIHLIRKFSK